MSTLYLLHNASKLTGDPGNLSLAKIRVSTISLLIFFFPKIANSLFKRLIIHNAEFDLSHLNNELAILGKKKINNEIVDTLILARDKFPGSPVSLDALCKRYRIDNSKRTQHTALIDCDLLAKVYINLIDQKEPTLNFQIDETKTNLKINESKDYFKKIVSPSAEELKKHKEYLKNNLKKNFF